MRRTAVEVRGAASAEELAVLIAMLGRVTREPELSSYERWRRDRLAALRAEPTLRRR